MDLPGGSILPLLNDLSSDRLDEEEEDVLAETVRVSDEVGLGNQANETIKSRTLLNVQNVECTRAKTLKTKRIFPENTFVVV
jgi:hypothetical protein